ncbi:MAG: ABC transporter ATP-binding protein [Rufibacter sp.]
MGFLEVIGICKREVKGDVLKNITFSQPERQKIAIAGETGSGKSTLLKIIAGLIQPDAGTVYFKGDGVCGPHEKLVAGHADIAYLSQHHELAEFLRVEQVLEYANMLEPQEAEMLFRVCQIDHLLSRKTNQLSGGESQRIALARLLLSSPGLLLLDEPFSNLDLIHKSTLKEVIRDVAETLAITCVLVSHDALDTLSWADQILVMKDGVIIQEGTPQQIYQQPANTYVAGLFGKYNLLDWVQYRHLLDLPEEDYKGKKLLLRPEHLLLYTACSKSVPAEVQRTEYYGSYELLEVSLGGEKILVKNSRTPVSPGERITLSLASQEFWFLPNHQ